jgi:hypothetical protein
MTNDDCAGAANTIKAGLFLMNHITTKRAYLLPVVIAIVLLSANILLASEERETAASPAVSA